jgi:hypothetical protein
MVAYVVAAEQSDVELLRRLLDEELRREVKFFAGDGLDGVTSGARTLVSQGRPVAIVIDAYASEPEAVRFRQQSMEEVVGIVAGKRPFRVIMAVPALEIIFFEAPALLERMYPGRLSPWVLEIASLSTRRALKMLDPALDPQTFRKRVLDELKEGDIPALQGTSVIRELSDFLRMVQEREAQATGSRN